MAAKYRLKYASVTRAVVACPENGSAINKHCATHADFPDVCETVPAPLRRHDHARLARLI